MIPKGMKVDRATWEKMAKRRRAFATEEGLCFLSELVMSAKVYEAIDVADEADVAVRNFAIGIMSSLGMLSEEHLQVQLRNMLNTPLPEMFEEEGEKQIGAEAHEI